MVHTGHIFAQSTQSVPSLKTSYVCATCYFVCDSLFSLVSVLQGQCLSLSCSSPVLTAAQTHGSTCTTARTSWTLITHRSCCWRLHCLSKHLYTHVQAFSNKWSDFGYGKLLHNLAGSFVPIKTRNILLVYREWRRSDSFELLHVHVLKCKCM